MRRVRKIALWVFGVGLTLGAIGLFGVQRYLGSSAGRQLVAERASTRLGMPVEVTSLDVGFGSTRVSVVIPDPAADPPADFLRIGSLDTDLTLGGLISGSIAPTTVTVRDVDFVLRLDENRKVVSPLPKLAGTGTGGKLPAVTVENARVRIRQPGKPEFDVSGVNATLRADGDGYAIRGEVADTTWGKWRIEGRLAADPADGHVTFLGDDIAVNDPLLRRIPFVREKVWRHLSATGSTAAKVTLTFPPDGDVTYAVDLQPKGLTAGFPDAAVTVADVTGDVRIAGDKVTATGVGLALAGGRATARGVFDFESDVSVLTLKVSASGLDVRQLPAEWAFPKQIEGNLRGTAELELHIAADGILDTRGTGSGEVEDGTFVGLPAKIELRMRGDKGRYYFETPPPWWLRVLRRLVSWYYLETKPPGK